MGSHPSSSVPDLDAPKTGWAYFNTTDKKVYLHDGTGWAVMLNLSSADVTGLTIEFIGQHSSHIVAENSKNPEPPTDGWVYFNTSDGKTYLYDSGWTPIAFGAKTWTVDFETGDGSAVSGQVVLAGGKATRPADPFQSGHVFTGWKKSGAAWDFTTAVNEDTTLVAQWTAVASPYDREDFGTGAAIEYAAPAGVDSAQTWAAAINFINTTGSGNNYVIDITGSFVLEEAGTASNPDITKSGAVVSVRGRNGVAVLLDSTADGNLLSAQSYTTVILRDLTLMGHEANTSALVTVEGGLILKEGAAVCGNRSSSSYNAHGVAVTGAGAKFAMEGNARVHNNGWNGVNISGSNAEFTMGGASRIYSNRNNVGLYVTGYQAIVTVGNNAQIYDNGYYGITGAGNEVQLTMNGNAQVYNNRTGVAWGSIDGTFHMGGNAQIYGNKSPSGSGGVYVSTYGIFIMGGNAQIYGNSANQGGGVYVTSSMFTMGGNAQIYGNSANQGGGVYISSGQVSITGGVIYGTNAPSSLQNTAGSSGSAALYGTAQMGSFDSSGALPLAPSPQTLNTTDDTIRWAP